MERTGSYVIQLANHANYCFMSHNWILLIANLQSVRSHFLDLHSHMTAIVQSQRNTCHFGVHY